MTSNMTITVNCGQRIETVVAYLHTYSQDLSIGAEKDHDKYVSRAPPPDTEW